MAFWGKKTVSAVAACLTLTAGFEGYKTKPYWDPYGKVWTTCYGHTGADIDPKRTYTMIECTAWLYDDLSRANRAVHRQVKIEDLPFSVEVALTDFTFNLGEGTLKKSSVLMYVNGGMFTEACNAMTKYVYGGGVKLPGLVKRRNREKEVCLWGK